MDSVVAAYRILIFLLPLLYACHSVDFNNKLFQRYGTQAGLNASSLVLNGDNLTRLASDIVNGLHYNPKASLCQDVSTCSNQVGTTPCYNNKKSYNTLIDLQTVKIACSFYQ